MSGGVFDCVRCSVLFAGESLKPGRVVGVAVEVEAAAGWDEM
jgi:hypothetical protein